jgi:GDP-4-dehydro-6-deoxy-D-mannose reductase
VTGAGGFVGRVLCPYLTTVGDTVVRAGPGLDVRRRDEVASELRAAGPDVVYHLAGRTNVAESWADPTTTFEVNALGTLAVLEAAAALPSPPRVLLVSSSEVYGDGGRANVPLEESAPLRPVTPYAASKVAAEFLGLQAYLGRGLPVVTARPFNHIGPGQAPSFVVRGLAGRIAAVEQHGGGAISVGNLSAERDFTDVRDVVRAYRLLAERGEPGETYNVCSGEARSIEEIARRLADLAKVPIEFRVDPSLVRAVEVPVLLGECSRLARITGWAPEITLEQTLAAVLEEARAEHS